MSNSLLHRLALGLSTAALLAGCGGGGGGASSASTGPVTDPNSDLGQAAVSVVWPSRGRAVPIGANSVSVTVSKVGKALQTALAVRPEDGSPSVVSFANLPLGTLDVRVSAFASTNGTGSPLSTGASTLTSAQGTPISVSVPMDPVVASLALSALSLDLPQSVQTTLSVVAADASGTALATPDAVAWTSDAPGVVGVSGSGATATVSALGVGTTTIRATLVRADRTTVSTAATVTVSATGGTVTVH